MTAEMLEALLYHHLAMDPRSGRDAPPGHAKAMGQLLAAGLLVPDNEPSMFLPTEKGVAHIKQLCALELPTAVWLNKAGDVIE